MKDDKKIIAPCDCKKITITIKGDICGNVNLIDEPGFVNEYIKDKIEELERVLSKSYKLSSSSPFLYYKPKARFSIDIDEGDDGVADEIK